MALLDLPDLGQLRHDVPVLHLAAANSSAGWRAVPIEIVAGGEIRSAQSAFGEAIMGTTLIALGGGQPAIFDAISSLEVELADGDHWLESRDDAALVGGANLAAVGRELIQFGSAVPIGPKRFRLTRLLRGRRGTEWAMASHATGEPFVLLSQNSLRAIELPREALGVSVDVRALGIGDGSGPVISGVAGGEAMRPPSPVHLSASLEGGELQLGWMRRSRDGWAWLDEMDAPLGEGVERYRVRVETAAAVIETETAEPRITLSAAEVAELGSGAVTAMVVQIGDCALSRPAEIQLVLP